MKLLASLGEMIFPSRCLGCGVLGLEICSVCRRYWNPHLYKTSSQSHPSFPIYSSIPYSPIAGKVMLSAKENSLAIADQLIFRALLHSLEICRRETGIAFLVPIPSRQAVSRLRGRQFISQMSHRLTEATHLPTFDHLVHQRKVRDQSSLDAQARFKNLDGALASQGYLSGKAILVDDLVTTGSTLREAARALRIDGIEVAAAVTACVAKPLR